MMKIFKEMIIPLLLSDWSMIDIQEINLSNSHYFNLFSEKI